MKEIEIKKDTDKNRTVTLIILLGNENTPDGKLKPDAKKRADETIKLLKSHPNAVVLPTGSFGAYYNPTNTAHGEYLKRYLIDQGIDAHRILPFTYSNGTLDDAHHALRVTLKLNMQTPIDKVIVVSSKFHKERVEYIFGRLFPRFQLEYVFAEDDTNCSDYKKKIKDEKDKLERTMKELLPVEYIIDIPPHIYESLQNEHHHYDNLSVAVLSGILIIFYYTLQIELKDFENYESIPFFICCLILAFLLNIYIRLADFALNARKILKAYDYYYTEVVTFNTFDKMQLINRKGCFSSRFKTRFKIRDAAIYFSLTVYLCLLIIGISKLVAILRL